MCNLRALLGWLVYTNGKWLAKKNALFFGEPKLTLTSMQVNKIEIHADQIKVNIKDADEAEAEDVPNTPEACKERMLQINQFVKDVSRVAKHSNDCDSETNHKAIIKL